MNKITITFLLTIFFIGCSDRQQQEKVLSVTIEPQKYFLEQIVGDKYKVNCVVPNGSNPESFDLAPSQIMTIGKSEAYLKIGFLGIENTWIENIRKNNPHVKFFDCSSGINPIGGHQHDHALGEEQHSHHGHDDGDPHTWSAPYTARIIADNMYKAVIELDSKNKEYYTTNYNKLIAVIDSTDNVIKQYIDQATCKSFIIYHPALSYFAQEYGLKQLSIEYEGKNPSPKQFKELIDYAKQNNVKTVFIQQEFDAKNAETVANSIGGKAIPINLMAYDWSSEIIKIAKALAVNE